MAEENLYFLGIDPSATSTGVVLLNNTSGGSITTTIASGKLRDASRLKFINRELLDLLDGKVIQKCVMESPSYGSTHKEFILGEALGVIKLTLACSNVRSIEYASPTQLKKFLTGNHRASKPDMVREALLLGCPSLQNDVCDAWAAALLARSLHVGSSEIRTRGAQEVVAAIMSK